MATIVQHLLNNNVYILLGTSYAYYRDTTPGFLGGTDEGSYKVAAVCDENGEIFWAYTKDLKILEVDGYKLGELLGPFQEQNDEQSEKLCPGCGAQITTQDTECPCCELALFLSDKAF